MSKQPLINYPDNSINKEFTKAKAKVLDDPDIVAIRHKNPGCNQKIQAAFRRYQSRICDNVKIIRKSKSKSYKRLVDRQIKDIDSTIASYSQIKSSEVFHLDKPVLLCKYMPKDHAVENIINYQFKFGSIGEYRLDDPMECTIPIAPEEDIDGLFDIVCVRIINNILKEHNLDFKSLWNQLQDVICRDYFIGCFSDNQHPEYMWKKYAHDDGVCIWFKPVDNIHQIIYSDYLAKADDLRRKYSEILIKLATANYENVSPEFGSLIKELVDLSILSFYTKKLNNENEKDAEWRLIVQSPSDKESIKIDENGLNYILHEIPGTIVKIESRMPPEYNDKLRYEISKSTDSRLKIVEIN